MTTVALPAAEVIRAVAEADPEADAEDIAMTLLDDVTTAEAVQWLTEALPAYVREVLGVALAEVMADDADDGQQPDSPPPDSPVEASASPVRRRQPAVGGWRRGAAAAYAATWMAQRVDITGDGEGWKAIGQCTASELRECAENRRVWLEHVQENVRAAIDFLVRVADAVEAAGVATVRDLPQAQATAITA